MLLFNLFRCYCECVWNIVSRDALIRDKNRCLLRNREWIDVILLEKAKTPPMARPQRTVVYMVVLGRHRRQTVRVAMACARQSERIPQTVGVDLPITTYVGLLVLVSLRLVVGRAPRARECSTFKAFPTALHGFWPGLERCVGEDFWRHWISHSIRLLDPTVDGMTVGFSGVCMLADNCPRTTLPWTQYQIYSTDTAL